MPKISNVCQGQKIKNMLLKIFTSSKFIKNIILLIKCVKQANAGLNEPIKYICIYLKRLINQIRVRPGINF